MEIYAEHRVLGLAVILMSVVVGVSATADNSKAGVLPIARCRAKCISEYLKGHVSDDACQKIRHCVSCWNLCEQIFSDEEVWRDTCKNRKICTDGCQTACDFRTKFPAQTDTDQWIFPEIPAVTTEASKREAYVAWSQPIKARGLTDHESRDILPLIYVLSSRENEASTTARPWKVNLQTSSTGVVLDLFALPHDPEFWLLAVGVYGTVATVRFNSTISENVPWEKGVIKKSDSLTGSGEGSWTLLKSSTIPLLFNLSIVDGRLHPRISWKHPVVGHPNRKLEYQVHVLQTFWKSDDDMPRHWARFVTAYPHEQPELNLTGIVYNAHYYVQLELVSNSSWMGELNFTTPKCEDVDLVAPEVCDSDDVNRPIVVVTQGPIPSPRTTKENIGTGEKEVFDVDNKSDHNLFDYGSDVDDSGLDWNLTVTSREFDPASGQVVVTLKWLAIFNHSKVIYNVHWTNRIHTVHVDGGQNVVNTSDTWYQLRLRANSEYDVYVSATYSDRRDPVLSSPVSVSTMATENMPHVSLQHASVADSEKEILNGIILGVTVVSSLMMVGIIVLFVYKKRQSFRDIMLTKTAVAKSNSYKSNVGCKVDYSNQFVFSSDDWEIDCSQLKFASHIGQGAFGKVVTGYYQDEKVAIKLIRDCAPISYKEDLLAEINLMKRIGSHPNIVSMIGACTRAEPICLVMEYIPYGNLQNFLKKCRLEGELSVQPGRSSELNYALVDELGDINNGVITPADLLSFARQVAMAMEYLCDKKYVHRDLAARNVLLGYNKIIKVCDFGLSRDIFTDNQYKKLTNGKLPLKWMAIESLRDRVFTTQSDVWSFGILLWEIVTMGASPYPNIALADLYYLLSNNYRMDKPSNCSDELYIIMRQCWLETPTERPNFTDLRVQLELLLTRDRNYLELDNINVPLSTPESSSGSPVSDETKSLLAAQALQQGRKLSKDEIIVNMSVHDKSVEKLLKRKGDLETHTITIL